MRNAAAVLCALMLAPGVQADGPAPAGTEWSHTYRMRGEVRLLLFWVGRDGVGGGRICSRQSAGKAPGTWSEEVEVVFGSEPERVPGRVNRWGHARERAEWETADGKATLVKTVFDGLMRHSDSSTSAGVLRDNRQEAARGMYEYKALHGEVARDGATAEIRVFHDPREFHYRTPEPLVKHYHDAIASQPAKERNQLLNSGARYAEPGGFLGGLRTLIERVLAERVARPSVTAVHNAKLYRIEVRHVAYSASWPGLGEAGAVAVIRFLCTNPERSSRSEFVLAVPVAGPMRGIPVRIEYQPNWWLRVRLDMERPGGAVRP